MQIISWVIQALQLIILADAILSWLPPEYRRNSVAIALRQVTEPILRPIRRAIPPQKTGYLDLSPLIAIIGLTVLDVLLRSIVR